MGNKETACSNCIHLQVCSYKKDLLAAQEVIDGISLILPREETAMREVKLRDIRWINPVKLECIYYAPSDQPSIRNFPITTTLSNSFKQAVRESLEDRIRQDSDEK